MYKFLTLLLCIISFVSVVAQTPLWTAKYDASAFSKMQTGFSDDSKYFAYGSDNGEIIIVETASGNVYHSYKNHEKKIFCVLFQPKSNILISGDKKGKMVFYDYILKKEIRTIEAHTNAITNLCFNREGSFLVTGGLDNSVRFWDAVTGKKISEITNIKGDICSIKLTPNNKEIVVAANIYMGNGVFVYDIATGKKITVLKSSNTEYLDIAPNGKYIATANFGNIVNIWDVYSDGLFTLKGHTGNMKYVAYSPVKNILASASDSKKVIIWDLDKQNEIANFIRNGAFESLTFSPDGEYLVALNQDKSITMWKIRMLINNYDALKNAEVANKNISSIQDEIIKNKKVLTSDSDDKSSEIDDISNYYRSSLTIMFVNFNEKDPYAKDLKSVFDTLKVPGKYNDNQIDVKFVTPDFAMRPSNCKELKIDERLIQEKFDPENSRKIIELLQKEKVAHKIMSKWFNKSPDGKFDMNVVYERGMYNATDNEYNTAKYTHRGITTELKDAGQKLVDKSYILVIDFGTILTGEQFDNIKTYVKGQTYTKKGYMTNIKTYLFKIDGDVTQKIYDIWEDGKKFDQLDFPLKPVAQIFNYRIDAAGYVDNTRAGFIKEFVNKAINIAEFDIAQKFEDFRVKALIEKRRGGFFPVVFAKIGKKEDLSLDNRYFVWEHVEDKNGNRKWKRRGVVRVSNKVVDNRSVTSGNTGTTKFFQVQGGKLKPGMILQQQNDVNAGYTLGVSYAPMNFENAKSKLQYKSPLIYTVRVDVDLMQGAKGKKPTDFRVFFDINYQPKANLIAGQTIPDSLSSQSLKGNTTGAMGFSKDFHILKNVKLTPFVQGNIARQLTIGNHGTDNKYQLKLFHIGYGIRMPISLSYWVDLVPGITFYKERKLSNVSIKQNKILYSFMYINTSIRFSF